MAAPNVLGGNKFQVFVDDGASGWDFLCVATSKALNEQMNFEENFLPDCSDPDSIPARTSRPTGHQWDVPISGLLDPNSDGFKGLVAAYEARTTVNIKVVEDVTGGTSATGAVWVEALNRSAQGGGLSSFTATLRGEGALTKTTVS